MKKNLCPLRRILSGILYSLALIIACATALSSCNVTRVITNESQYVQRGDTSVLIQTKTVETYDASRKL